MSAHILIIGAGVAGVTAALKLAQTDAKVTLVEKESSLIGGPPFCHLHAGGNLYPDIDDAQCKELLRQSIEFAKFYPFIVDRRPTLFAVPKRCELEPRQLIDRLWMLKNEYKTLIESDKSLALLGEPESYFKLYDEVAVEKLRRRDTSNEQDRWLKAALPMIDLDKVKMPLMLVQEYGLNLFRLAAGAHMLIEHSDNIALRLNTQLVHLEQKGAGYLATVKDGDGTLKQLACDYVINAAGYQTGKVDEMLGLSCTKSVEFKAAYIAKWPKAKEQRLPEMIFHGKRGSDAGMGQFTPYGGGYIQLHAMTPRATLYPKGLAITKPSHCQARLDKDFVTKLTKGWQKEEIEERTREAIVHLSRFIPGFANAIVGAKPLYGAQQIPGDDPSLRVAEVSFPLKRYARCEIVKVSSAIDMAEAIVNDLRKEGLIDRVQHKCTNDGAHMLDEALLATKAAQIATQRGYPKEMASLLVP